jgi:type I restriction-modification system DNA methylase subunit
VRRSPSSLDCVLADTKEQVLKRQAQLKGKGLEDLDAQLRCASGFAFYNTSRYNFEKLRADAPHLAANLRNCIGGFSPNMREVLEKFDFDNTISKLDETGLLFQVLERFKNVDLHPDKIDNPTMGTIPRLAKRTRLTLPTIAKALEVLADQRIVSETSGRKRNRVYRYDRYLAILNEGTEPL